MQLQGHNTLLRTSGLMPHLARSSDGDTLCGERDSALYGGDRHIDSARMNLADAI